jgi:hypothetical protein
MLLNDALIAYIFGLYSSVILSSDAFCERLLTDATEIREGQKSERPPFKKIMKRVQKMKRGSARLARNGLPEAPPLLSVGSRGRGPKTLQALFAFVKIRPLL